MRHSAFRRGGGNWNKSFRGEEGFGTYKYTGGVEAVSWLTACKGNFPFKNRCPNKNRKGG